jgi:hypothetical protein
VTFVPGVSANKPEVNAVGDEKIVWRYGDEATKRFFLWDAAGFQPCDVLSALRR